MKAIISFIYIIAYFLLDVSLAQNSLSLRPSFGTKLPTCNIQSGEPNPKDFRINRIPTQAYFSAILQYNINKKWYIASGIDYGIIGYDFLIKDGKYRGGISHSKGAGLVGYPIQVGYTFRDVQFIRLNTQTKFMKMLGLDKKDLMYLMLFKLQLVGGITFNHIQKHTDEGETDYVGWQVNDFPVKWHESAYNVVRRRGMSISVGINMQFHNYGRDRFLISLLYEQGIQNRLDVPVRYGVGAEELGRTRLGSRGSGFILKASYPINLYRFKKNKFVEE